MTHGASAVFRKGYTRTLRTQDGEASFGFLLVNGCAETQAPYVFLHPAGVLSRQTIDSKEIAAPQSQRARYQHGHHGDGEQQTHQDRVLHHPSSANPETASNRGHRPSLSRRRMGTAARSTVRVGGELSCVQSKRSRSFRHLKSASANCPTGQKTALTSFARALSGLKKPLRIGLPLLAESQASARSGFAVKSLAKPS